MQCSFNDRGRGPDVRGWFRFDDKGMPVAIDLTGHDYYRAPVDEHFTFAGGEVRRRP